jgi:hypothetical protein
MSNTPPMGDGALEATTGQDVDTSISRLPDRTERDDRITLARQASARCLMCPARWSDSWALAHAVNHRTGTGHVVVGRYSADYLWFRPDRGGAS